MKNTVLRVHLASLLAFTIHAANYNVVKYVTDFVHPYAIIVLRLLVAISVFSCITILKGNKISFHRSDVWRLLLCAICGASINMLLFYQGVSLTYPSNAALIMTVTPVLVFLVAYFSGKEKLDFLKVMGLVMAFGGAVLLATSKGELGIKDFKGDVLVFINAILYGSYLILVKPLVEKYQQSYLFALLFSIGLIFSLPFGYNDTISIDWKELPVGAYWGLLYIGVAVTYGTFVLIAYALKNASPSLVGLYMYLQPVLTWGFSLLLGTEEFLWSKLGIGLVIMAGVYLVTFQRKTDEAV